MKFSKLLLMMTLLIAPIVMQLAGCTPKQKVTAEISSNNSNQTTIADIKTTTRKYEVFGMNCPGCHGGLEKLINKIDGVLSSKANWERQYLNVVIASKFMIDDKLIYAAIKDANFTPGERLK